MQQETPAPEMPGRENEGMPGTGDTPNDMPDVGGEPTPPQEQPGEAPGESPETPDPMERPDGDGQPATMPGGAESPSEVGGG